MSVDISIPAADTVGMVGLRQRKRSQRRTNGVIARHVQLGGLLIGEASISASMAFSCSSISVALSSVTVSGRASMSACTASTASLFSKAGGRGLHP